ncbi:MAG TPA: hypothetical protein VGG39_28600 [Polyangiaceae bacterium]|jgi:hypothetical protein
MNAPPGISTSWYRQGDKPAQAAYLSWLDASGTRNWITFDVVESESWDGGADVSEHPVEEGANVTDHVRVRLTKCTLKVFVSNEPIDAAPYAGTQQTVAQVTTAPISVPTPSWMPGNGIITLPSAPARTPGSGVITATMWNSNIDLRALAGNLVGLAGGLSGPLGQVGGVAIAAASAALIPGYKTEVPYSTDAGLPPPAPGAITIKTDAGLLPPVPKVMTATVQTYGSPTDFVAQMHTQLVYLKDQAQELEVYGTKQTNLTMVIETLSSVRDVDTGSGESFTIGLKELRKVMTKMVPQPIPHLPGGGGLPSASHGAQTPTPATKPVMISALKTLSKTPAR